MKRRMQNGRPDSEALPVVPRDDRESTPALIINRENWRTPHPVTAA